MSSRKIHKILGLILLVPFLGWILTGVVFLVKPGYSNAYERVSPKTYPIESDVLIRSDQGWHESRLLKTVLGYHLLVRKNDDWHHIDPATMKRFPKPDEKTLVLLLEDLVSSNNKRYGRIVEYKNDVFYTDTGVELTIDWDTLSISQHGRDTRLINTLYKIHYLQWFRHKATNLIFGIVGLSLLFLLVVYGVVTYLSGRKQN